MKNMQKKTVHICKGCGKEIEENQRAIRVQAGKLKTIKRRTAPSEKTIWGYMHAECFYIAIGDHKGLQDISKAS